MCLHFQLRTNRTKIHFYYIDLFFKLEPRLSKYQYRQESNRHPCCNTSSSPHQNRITSNRFGFPFPCTFGFKPRTSNHQCKTFPMLRGAYQLKNNLKILGSSKINFASFCPLLGFRLGPLRR